MGGRHTAPQAHSTNVMCHVPAGTPTVPHARGGKVRGSGVPGWLTAPTARPPWGGGPRAPAPTVPVLVNPAEHPTSASIVESPSAPWKPPRPHSRHHQAPGSGSGLLERKWCRPRPGPRRSPWWVPPIGTSRTMGIAWGEARSEEIGPVRGRWRLPWTRPRAGPKGRDPQGPRWGPLKGGSPAMTDRVGGWGRNGFGHMVSSKNSGSVEPFFLPSNFCYPPPPTPLPILGSRVGGGITVL